MNKFKLFIENFIIYGFGGIISKVIPVVMVPIITRMMPNSSYYGISDLSNTLVSLGQSLAVMGMYDAMYRMFFENDEIEYKKTVCSTALSFTLLTSIIVFLLMLIFKNYISQFFFGNKEYAYLVYLTAMATLMGATNNIISAPVRMQNKRRIFLIANTISPIISYLISIPLLLAGYYVIALPIASVISGLTMEIVFYMLNKSWFNIKKFDFTVLKQLLKIAIPLFPNFMIYWIFNSSDKIMITNLIGLGPSGIYSVGSKLGHCSQLIYTAFSGGWQYFAFSTMRDDNQVESNSLIYEYLAIISYIFTMLICCFSFLIFKMLFSEEYISGYLIAPYLFLSPLLQMIFQVACNQFIIIKKTWPNMLILLSGAIINVILNLFLIPVLGIEGAAIATLIGYAVSNIICIIVLKKLKLMIVTKRFIVASTIMVIYFIIWRVFFNTNIITSLTGVVIIILIYFQLYKVDMYKLIGED